MRITFEGRTKNKRNQTVNLFKVEVAEDFSNNADDEVTVTDVPDLKVHSEA